MAYIIKKSIGTNVSNQIHIVKSICIHDNFVLQKESQGLKEFTENEMTGPGNKSCGQ
jgi:hypothetical protein